MSVMHRFRATHKTTGEVSEYDAPAPFVEHYGENYRLEELVTVEPPPEEEPPPPTVYDGRRRITKQEFLDLLGNDFPVILAASKQSVVVEAWVMRFEVQPADADGLSINLDDPLTIAGLNALESAGLIAVGRAAQILAG